MDFLRSKGLPIPKVYAYSFTSKNEAETEYILMEYVQGTDLSQIWFELKEDEIISLMDQLAKIESTMMSISFPAGGSIYYARDLKELSGNEGIPLDEQIESLSLEKERFCIGPDVSGYRCGMGEGNNWTYSEGLVCRTSPISSASS
jgi:serine/threonine protein kinase